MYKSSICFAALLAVAIAVPIHELHHIEHHAPANYNFEYKVHDPHTHDVKSQWEKRVGDKVVGQYKVMEPDGTMRIVDYTADGHSGFKAVVRREGHAHHPEISYQEHVGSLYEGSVGIGNEIGGAYNIGEGYSVTYGLGGGI